MVEINIIQHTRKASSLSSELSDYYEWYSVGEESKLLFEHLLPMHNASSLNVDDVDKITILAEAHGWTVKVNTKKEY